MPKYRVGKYMVSCDSMPSMEGIIRITGALDKWNAIATKLNATLSEEYYQEHEDGRWNVTSNIIIGSVILHGVLDTKTRYLNVPYTNDRSLKIDSSIVRKIQEYGLIQEYGFGVRSIKNTEIAIQSLEVPDYYAYFDTRRNLGGGLVDLQHEDNLETTIVELSEYMKVLIEQYKSQLPSDSEVDITSVIYAQPGEVHRVIIAHKNNPSFNGSVYVDNFRNIKKTYQYVDIVNKYNKYALRNLPTFQYLNKGLPSGTAVSTMRTRKDTEMIIKHHDFQIKITNPNITIPEAQELIDLIGKLQKILE